MDEILRINGVTKKYNQLTAVNNFSLTVKRGDVYGILGPNGSGKTTILSIVTGIIFANNGEYSWFGDGNNDALRKKIGSIVEVPNFYPYLSLKDNLKLVARIKELGDDDIERVLTLTNLINRADDRFYTLSLGMKQRLAIAATLLGDPEVLILDEPTNGLDPEGIAEVREIIIAQAAKGKTILLASHILYEVEKVCSHVAVLKEGNLLACGRVSELLVDDDLVFVSAEDIESLNSFVQHSDMVKNHSRDGNSFILTLKSGFSAGDLNKAAFEKKIVLTRLETKKKSLESQFLELVK